MQFWQFMDGLSGRKVMTKDPFATSEKQILEHSRKRLLERYCPIEGIASCKGKNCVHFCKGQIRQVNRNTVHEKFECSPARCLLWNIDTPTLIEVIKGDIYGKDL